MEKRTGAADPDEKFRGMRWECVRTEQRCGDEYRAAGGRGNQGGGRICVDIQQAVLWLTTTPQANTWAVSFTVTKLDLDWSGFGACFFFFLFCQDLSRLQPSRGSSEALIQAPKWGRFLLRAHTHKLNRSSSSFSRYHPQFALWISRTYEPLMSSVRLFVMGALQRRCCVLKFVQAMTHPGWDEVGCGMFVSLILTLSGWENSTSSN